MTREEDEEKGGGRKLEAILRVIRFLALSLVPRKFSDATYTRFITIVN